MPVCLLSSPSLTVCCCKSAALLPCQHRCQGNLLLMSPSLNPAPPLQPAPVRSPQGRVPSPPMGHLCPLPARSSVLLLCACPFWLGSSLSAVVSFVAEGWCFSISKQRVKKMSVHAISLVTGTHCSRGAKLWLSQCD